MSRHDGGRGGGWRRWGRKSVGMNSETLHSNLSVCFSDIPHPAQCRWGHKPYTPDTHAKTAIRDVKLGVCLVNSGWNNKRTTLRPESTLRAEEIGVPGGGCAEKWGALSLGGGDYTIPSHKSFKKNPEKLGSKKERNW